MLVRAARRRFQHRHYRNLQPCFEDLHLPWLCPAVYRDVLQRQQDVRKTSTIAPACSTRGPRQSYLRLATASTGEAPSTLRGHASAAAIGFQVAQDDFIPFEGSRTTFGSPSTRIPFSEPESISTLRAFDPSSTIVINDSLSSAPRKFRSINAISGEIAEIQQTLHACLQVGRFERAAALMRRLNKIFKPGEPELLSYHNNYLRELSLKIMRTRDRQLLKDVHRWFEVDLRGVGVIPDPTTYFLMIQASLKEPAAKKAQRTVRRYLQFAEEAGLRDEVMKVMLEFMDEQDFGRVTSIAPMYDHEAEESVEDDIKADHPTLEIPDISTPDIADTVPAVRAVQQKGSGVIALKKALSMFSSPGSSPPPNELQDSEENREKAIAYERQQRLEKDVCQSAIERWRTENEHLKKMGISSVLKQGSIGSLMWNWYEALVPLIKEEVRKVDEAEEKKLRTQAERQRCLYGPFLRLLSPEKIAALSILEIMTVLGTYVSNENGSKLSMVVLALGQAIQDESTAESISNTGEHNPWERRSRSQRVRRMSKLIARRQVHKTSTESVDGLGPLYPSQTLEWSHGVKARIGAILLSHLLDVAMVEVTCKDPETGLEIKELQPAFFHQFRYKSGKSIGVVNLNQAMVGKMGKEPLHSALSKNLPMVVEPKPWTGYKEGGFLRNSSSVVRFKPSDQQVRRYAEVASQNGDMAQVFAGLDVLARTPWKINRAVFDIMLEAWNSGEGIAKIPPENPKVEYPPEPASSDDEGVRRRWFRQMKEIEDYKCGLKSQRCFQNFQLEVARAFMKETFYFPHNVDFRGRAYPMSPFFNHMGADNCRGLLAFGKGRELGRTGLKWLKIHLASLYGYDKASFEERQKFAEDHLTEIYDAANRGLKGDRWWLKAEDPWQCLAACIELRNALESPDPQQYVSHLPIHQDGTCNGLQHYAALGGDVIGAKQVNLEPGERPSDIYTGVADMIKAEIAEEAAQGSEIARLLHGRLTRKMVKQPVMTNVYGVTYVGAIRQVRKQLDVLTDFPDNASVNLTAAARYITKKIFKSLATMFNGAHDIQFWLAECANRISDSLTPEQLDWIEKHAEGIDEVLPYAKKPVGARVKIRRETCFRSAVIWTTPLKMPVVQPYRSSPENVVKTNLQRLSITPPNGADPVNKRQQLQAFPPNFIHSLDATHMILSALKCNEAGLTFAAVHDSFWTHAADVEVMNTILRDTFIRMHSEDIMGRLAAEFAVRYKGSMYQASVSRSSALGKKIAAYRKATEKTRENVGRLDLKEMEVMEERRRLKLLASEDPKEREEGESMMTAGRIYAEHAGGKDLAVSEDLEEMGISHIPDPRSIKLQANEQLEVRDSDNVETPEPSDEFADEGEKLEKEPKKSRGKSKIWVWLPLTFPPVPKKGEFNISRLKESKYFFS